MPRKKKAEEASGGAPEWLATFADMMSLLLTFFVLLVSFASFENEKIKEAIISLKGALGVMRPSVNLISQPVVPFKKMSKKPPKEGSESEELKRKRLKIQAKLARQGLDKTVGSYISKDGIVLVALSPVFFDPGSAEIREDSYEALSLIAEIISEYENPVRVEGYTSDVPPPQGSPYPTNWELSGARASAIVRYFIEKHGISPDRLSFVGHGSSRPAIKSKSLQARYLNDRVEIKLVSTSESPDIESHLIRGHKEIPEDTEAVPPGNPESDQNSRGP